LRFHLVRVVVWDPARSVVEVVELADGGEPGQHHLGEGRPRQREVEIRVDRVGDLVHPLAPGPEVAPARLAPSPQGALEDM